MGYYYRGDVRADVSTLGDGYGDLSRAEFFRETKTKAEVKKRLLSASIRLPLGTIVSIFRVYRISRGYEPGKPRSGSEDQHEYLKLAAHGAWHDPKTGKAKPAKWVRVEAPTRSTRMTDEERREMLRDRPARRRSR